jgi:hypothetical protein
MARPHSGHECSVAGLIGCRRMSCTPHAGMHRS